MLEEFLNTISENTQIIGILIVFLVLFIVSFIKKIEKLAVLTLIGLIAYAAYLYYTDKEPSEKGKQIIENPQSLIKNK